MRVNRWSVGRRFVQGTILLLLASPSLGPGIFEGNLAASSLLGLPLSDPLATLQVLMLTGSVTSTLLIGTAVVLVVYGLLGGRSFCGWVCPVHLLTELTDLLPWSKRLPLRSLSWKYPALAVFLALSLLFGVPAFETLSPIGITTRALTFGSSLSLVLLGLLVVSDLFLARRLWCRSLCPLGAVYTLWGRLSPVAVAYLPERCSHCGDCQASCFVPEVLTPCLTRQAPRVHSGECSRCGACIGTCPDQALTLGLRKPFGTF